MNVDCQLKDRERYTSLSLDERALYRRATIAIDAQQKRRRHDYPPTYHYQLNSNGIVARPASFTAV